LLRVSFLKDAFYTLAYANDDEDKMKDVRSVTLHYNAEDLLESIIEIPSASSADQNTDARRN
jgi:hypothetical protein